MRVAAVLAVALGILPASMSAQSGSPASVQPPLQPPLQPMFRSESALVALNVTVQDDGARFVSGLQPGDFVVYEDGVKQDVRFFESSAVPIDLILLIDTSASMLDKLTLVHDAASGFLKTLREGDRGAVVGFADSVNVLQPLTADRALLEQAVRTTNAKGSTALNNAVYVALKQFGRPARDPDKPRRQAFVVLSDGEDTSSVISLDDVLGLARRTGVNVYTVLLQSNLAARERAEAGRYYVSTAEDSMKTLARETGAQAFFPAPTGLKSVYGTIASELASQYSIGYVPANSRLDGAFRRVVVQVVTRPSLHPRTRRGYTADGAGSIRNNGGADRQ